jgi:hypothetical protein
MDEGPRDPAGGASPRPAYATPVPPEKIARLGPVALRAYQRLTDLLDLSQVERMALLGLPENAAWPDPAKVSDEQFYRISYLIGIWQDTAGFFGIDTAIRRLKAPRSNEWMAGRSAIAYLSAEGLPAFDELRREAAYWANNGW